MAGKRYEIVAAFDTETTNIGNIITGYRAFPILYQFAELQCEITQLKPETSNHLVSVQTFRDHESFYEYLDGFALRYKGCTPVVLVHNLGFDMYALAPYLSKHDVKVLAKTARKPISIQVLDDDGKAAIVFLDTLGLFMKPLSVMGEECGMPKAVGDWDYDLVRTPETPLTEDELHYARQDTITLLCYMSYFLRQNPDINPHDIGMRVQTKTGVVRSKRLKHLGNLKGKKLKKSVQQYWHLQNKSMMPETDDELFTMHASTRGGFTFCAKNNASRVFHAKDGMRIESYDSTSQHPGQMCSHLYPIEFKEVDSERLGLMFESCKLVKIERVLDHWAKPFPFAFYGAFVFTNLRPKAGSLWEREGIYPLASARIGGNFPIFDNEANASYRDAIGDMGYKDSAQNAVCNFGKLESASECVLYLTELEAWIVNQCYDYDAVEAQHGYYSSTFRKPSDLSILSVMRFYRAKDALKEFMGGYQPGKTNDVSGIEGLFPDSFVTHCEQGKADAQELKDYYFLAKSDLNALFGIEATNECRRDFELSDDGIVLTGVDGLHNMPAKPKCTYQYGQRIVGWSRIAQVVIMTLIEPYVQNVICGDTDSIKIYYHESKADALQDALKVHARALDKAKKQVCRRIQLSYKDHFAQLPGIGHYVFDGAYDAFSASWNKAYIGLVDSTCHVTLAGMPNRRTPGKNDSLDDYCNALMQEGMTFDQVAETVLGYNATFDYTILKLNGRLHPHWGEMVSERVTDYQGNTHMVHAPAALALFRMPKTIGDTDSLENSTNCGIAVENNPNVNTKPILLRWQDGKPIIER